MQNAWLKVQRMVVMEKVKVVPEFAAGDEEDHREHTEVGAFYSKLESWKVAHQLHQQFKAKPTGCVHFLSPGKDAPDLH